MEPSVIAPLPTNVGISDEAFSYLSIQRGAINDLAGNRREWEDAYWLSLHLDYETMPPWLPSECEALLDVGGGMSGISALLVRHYAMRPDVVVLDGLHDRPVVTTHNASFSHFEACKRFLRGLGVERVGCVTPAMARDAAATVPSTSFDLIISLQAWCFHFEPKEYLRFARTTAKPGAVLIVDVRRGRVDWIEDLRREFAEIAVAHEGPKFRRMVYRNER